MTRSFLYGTLTVELEGRIDTTNAADIDKELFELVDANNPRKSFFPVAAKLIGAVDF